MKSTKKQKYFEQSTPNMGSFTWNSLVSLTRSDCHYDNNNSEV